MKEIFWKSNTLGDYDMTVTAYGQQKVITANKYNDTQNVGITAMIEFGEEK